MFQSSVTQFKIAMIKTTLLTLYYILYSINITVHRSVTTAQILGV